jgi:hypothetical protein
MYRHWHSTIGPLPLMLHFVLVLDKGFWFNFPLPAQVVVRGRRVADSLRTILPSISGCEDTTVVCVPESQLPATADSTPPVLLIDGLPFHAIG